MLQVVGKAGIVGRIVLSAGMHGDVGLDAGLILIDGHVHLEPVVKRVNLGLQRVTFYGLVPRTASHGRQGRQHKKENFSHRLIVNYEITQT